MNQTYLHTYLSSHTFPEPSPIDSSIVNHWGAKTVKITKMSGMRTACTSVNLPDLRTDRVDNNRQEAPSLSSQASLPATSVPFVPRNSLFPQQDEDKDSLSVSGATMPKPLPQQQQANKKELTVSSPSFDPSWRQKLGKSPALPSPGSIMTTSTAMRPMQQDSRSARGGLATMMMAPGVYDHPTNMMPPSPMPIGEVT